MLRQQHLLIFHSIKARDLNLYVNVIILLRSFLLPSLPDSVRTDFPDPFIVRQSRSAIAGLGAVRHGNGNDGLAEAIRFAWPAVQGTRMRVACLLGAVILLPLTSDDRLDRPSCKMLKPLPNYPKIGGIGTCVICHLSDSRNKSIPTRRTV